MHAARRLRNAVARGLRRPATSGKNILGSGFDLDLVVHSGAGAYICGEETALLDSLEGFRGQPRLRPPFPATHGLYACPTVVNNVGTIASVPYIVLGGAAWWRSMGTEKSSGPMIYSLSGRIANPGQYECGDGHHAARADRAGRRHAARARAEVLDAGRLVDAAADRRAHRRRRWTSRASAAAGSILGTTATQIFSDQDCPVYATYRWLEFYHHESCGKCTPCREGNYWMVRIYRRILSGQGTHEDLDTLLDTCDNILGRSFCGLGDGATSPVTVVA